jgi:NlpC/P60 family/Bacterial dipeptidyl-peptidase Sh3 domain
MMRYDPRITPIRDDLASTALQGLITAKTYQTPIAMQVSAPIVPVRAAPMGDAEQWDQMVFGEGFDLLAEIDGFGWGQARRDGYVGYVDMAALSAPILSPTHRISALRTYGFSEPSIKSAPIGLYSLNALVTVEGREGRFVRSTRGAGWFVESQLAPIGQFETDPVSVAERFLGAPYQWGGRESLGLDCSGLVQQAFYACGLTCPRDSDMQSTQIGASLYGSELRRGDLVFWKGHVGLMQDETRLLHANAHHMAVTSEPLEEAVQRIEAAGSGKPTAFRRL